MMLVARLGIAILAAYCGYLAVAMLAGIDLEYAIGPTGSWSYRAIRPVLAVYLDILGVRLGAVGLVAAGLLLGAAAWQGTPKPAPEPDPSDGASEPAPTQVDSGDGC